MSDDTPETEGGDSGRDRGADPDHPDGATDRSVAGFDDRLVDILSWVLETETRARIYLFLRQRPRSTSEEVAEGTGLYPSTVREALAGLAEEEKVTRRKRQSDGAGNNPYEYTAMAPGKLVSEVVGQLQDQLNALCALDSLLGNGEEPTAEPVRIEVSDWADEPQAVRREVGNPKR